MLTSDLGSPNSSTWTAATHPSMKEAALRIRAKAVGLRPKALGLRPKALGIRP